MKKITLIILILISFKSYSQTLSEKNLHKIEKFGINYKNFNLDDDRICNDFNLILKKEKLRRTGKIMGIFFASYSTLTISSAIFIISRDSGGAQPAVNTIGGIVIATGLIAGGFSIPLFISSRKQKKERDKLIELYKTEENW